MATFEDGRKVGALLLGALATGDLCGEAVMQAGVKERAAVTQAGEQEWGGSGSPVALACCQHSLPDRPPAPALCLAPDPRRSPTTPSSPPSRWTSPCAGWARASGPTACSTPPHTSSASVRGPAARRAAQPAPPLPLQRAGPPPSFPAAPARPPPLSPCQLCLPSPLRRFIARLLPQLCGPAQHPLLPCCPARHPPSSWPSHLPDPPVCLCGPASRHPQASAGAAPTASSAGCTSRRTTAPSTAPPCSATTPRRTAPQVGGPAAAVRLPRGLRLRPGGMVCLGLPGRRGPAGLAYKGARLCRALACSEPVRRALPATPTRCRRRQAAHAV